MGLKSWYQGHGWDGTRETPAEQHVRTMREEVEAWKAKYGEPHQERPTTQPLTYDELNRADQRFVEHWQRNRGDTSRGDAGRDALAQRLVELRTARGMETPRELPGVARVKEQAETLMRADVAMVRQRAEEIRTRATVIREYYAHGEQPAPQRDRAQDRSQGWER